MKKGGGNVLLPPPSPVGEFLPKKLGDPFPQGSSSLPLCQDEGMFR